MRFMSGQPLLCYDYVFQTSEETFVPDHISRRELKQDKIKETLEHGAEAVFSHSQLTLAVLLVVLVAAAVYGGWRIYNDRKTVEASAAFDAAQKTYSARVGPPMPGEPVDPSEPSFTDENARAQDASKKFADVAAKYPSTNPGKWARYYYALCLEDLEQHNQAIEELKKITSGSDRELSAMAQYQLAVIDARTGKTDEAVKIYRALADKGSVFVSRPLVLLELAGVLRQKNPQEAATVYQQVKKEFPDTPLAEEADRGLGTLSPKS
jgi:predicted negative regulator of RcsB-dependent stress response